MKRSILLVSALALLMMTQTTISFAADLMLGATSWYAKRDRLNELPSEYNMPDSNEKIKTDNSLFYGPAVGFSFFDDWTISGNFLYGKLKYDSTEVESTGEYQKNESRDKRYESDLTLSYRVLSWLRAFAGLKYCYIKTTEDNYYYNASGIPTGHPGYDEGKMKYYAPGLGVGVSFPVPVIEGLNISANTSYIILRGTHEEMELDYNTSGQIIKRKDIEWEIKGWSINSTASLSYYVKEISTSIILGYRYQYLKYDVVSQSGTSIPGVKFVVTDKFYGITLSAMYFLSL